MRSKPSDVGIPIPLYQKAADLVALVVLSYPTSDKLTWWSSGTIGLCYCSKTLLMVGFQNKIQREGSKGRGTRDQVLGIGEMRDSLQQLKKCIQRIGVGHVYDLLLDIVWSPVHAYFGRIT